MNDSVVFDVTEFRESYPKIALTDKQLELSFEQATMILNKSNRGAVKMPIEKRKILLYLLVAHLATLQSRIDDGNDAVGKVTSASEGSVSVSLDAGQASLNTTFFQQTQYGAMYLSLTAKYRSFLYTMGFMSMPVRRYRGNR